MDMKGITDVPLDLIFGILLWLPVASLLRFKSVCKSWLSLIQSSDFVYQHIAIDSDSNSDSDDSDMELLLLTMPWRLNNPQHLSLIWFNDEADQVFQLGLPLPVIHGPFQLTHVELVASCNGIICLRQHRSVCLWNPATQQSITFPPLPVQPIPNPNGCFIGFGFDVKTNDYKVVCINRFGLDHDHTAHICSLKSDSWKTIDPPSELIQNIYISSDLKLSYRNTTYCWLVMCWSKKDRDGILTFDFSGEVFGFIPLPVDDRFETPLSIFILRENIACSIRLESLGYTGSENCFEIWTLNDFGVSESWTKLYSFLFCSLGGDWMTWFPKNGDSLLMFWDGQLCSYDLGTQERKNLSAHMSSSQVVMYAESLVSVERGNGAAKSMNPKDANGELLISKSMSRDTNCWCDIDIPKVVVFRILLWLPVASLLRFKSVCKSWATLIKSTDFVDQHLLHHQHPYGNDNVNLILRSIDDMYWTVFEDSSSPYWKTSYACLLSDNKIELLDLPSLPELGLRITTSFNGIICLNENRHELGVYLWNPATKQIRNITVDRDWNCLCDDCAHDKKFNFAFGLDTKTNDYKLVRFHSGFGGDRPNVFDIYSLSTDSWRTVDDKCLPTFDDICAHLRSPYRNRFYCWLVRDRTTKSHTILSFDFSSEEFSATPLPESIDQSLFSFELAIFQKNVACICMENISCEIWMMSEYGVEESWTKIYTGISLPRKMRMDLAYSKKNQDVILSQDYRLSYSQDDDWSDECGFIVMYEFDLATQERKELHFPVRGPHAFEVNWYQESLVPI